MTTPLRSPKDRAPARVGQVLRGKWRLDELLAVGGMASVFAATHRNGKRGAVKLLHYELSLNEEQKSRFLREGYVANKVDHEGAVSVLDDDVCEDGTTFLVMELLDGQTVDAVLRSRKSKTFGLGETLRVADRLLDVLAAAHDKGIIHRDIKPENIFLTKDGKLKVLDFGIARLREAHASADTTRAGDLLGTPSFMPPEQARGDADLVDPRSDVWSVGATMFRLLTGRTVHQAESINRVLFAAMTTPAPPIGRVLPSIPGPLAALVDRALAFEPKDRWPDARTMRSLLHQYAASAGVRLEGQVQATPDEARARGTTLPLETTGGGGDPYAPALTPPPAPPGMSPYAPGATPIHSGSPYAPPAPVSPYAPPPPPAPLPQPPQPSPYAVPPPPVGPAGIAPQATPIPVAPLSATRPITPGAFAPPPPPVPIPPQNSPYSPSPAPPAPPPPPQTPTFATAVPVVVPPSDSRDPSLAVPFQAPKTRPLGLFVVLGAAAVLASLVAVLFLRGGSDPAPAAGSGISSTAPVTPPVTPSATPAVTATPSSAAPADTPEPSAAPLNTATPEPPAQPSSVATAPPAQPPAKTTTSPVTTSAPVKKSGGTTPPKTDPFGSRKW